MVFEILFTTMRTALDNFQAHNQGGSSGLDEPPFVGCGTGGGKFKYSVTLIEHSAHCDDSTVNH